LVEVKGDLLLDLDVVVDQIKIREQIFPLVPVKGLCFSLGVKSGPCDLGTTSPFRSLHRAQILSDSISCLLPDIPQA